MRASHITIAVGVLVTIIGWSVSARAQQVSIRSPFHTASDSFYETNAINWSGQYRGVTFSYGGGALATPPFGSPQPNAGLTTNFGFANKDGFVNFSTTFGQGYKQSLVSQTPSVTIMNGQQGFMSDTSQTPFVVSVIPVVGAFPTAPPAMPQMAPDEAGGIDQRVQAMLQARADAQDQAAQQAAAQAQAGGPLRPMPAQVRPNALAPRQNQGGKAADPAPAAPDPGDAAAARLNAAQQSTAGRPAPSVAEAKRMHQQEQASADEELAAMMVRAQALEEDGKPSVAKVYYQRIAKHATGALQQQARQKLYELDGGK